MTTGTGWGRVPALDGVRGLAVVAVLLFHGGVSWARGGFLGVDAFFVLSGLLITSLLLEEGEQRGAVDLGHFWARRARRLLPALLVVVAACGLYGAIFATPDALAALRKDALATLAYVANWRFVATGGSYFEVTAQPSVLRHTWSLAIEEQFYVIWPLVMFAVVRSRSRLALTGALAGLGAVASAVAMAVLFVPGTDTSRVYYGTDTRAQVVLTGALLAAVIAVIRQGPELSAGARAALGVGSVTGAAVFVAAVVTVRGSEVWLFRGGFLVVALGVGAVLADVVLVPNGVMSRALSWSPLRGVGLISYGLYLWHWPVYLTLTHDRTNLSGAALLALRLLVTLVASVTSYFALEQPIRRGALPHWRAGLLAPIAVVLAAVIVLAGTVTPPARAASTIAASDPTPVSLPASHRPARAVGTGARVLVVGDSVAKTLAKRYERTSRSYDLTLVNKGVLGCGVVRGGPYRYFGDQRSQLRTCETWPQQWAKHVETVDPDVVLLIVGRWEVMDRVHDGEWTRLGRPSFDRYIESELDTAVRILSLGGATVAVATAPYFLRGERPDGGRWPEDDPRRVDRFNALVRSVVARYPDRSMVLELNERTSRGHRYTPVIKGVPMRFDGVHFSAEGAVYLAPWMLGTLRDLAPPTSGNARPTTTTRMTTQTTRTTFRTTTTGFEESTTSTTSFEEETTTSTTEEPTTTTSEQPTTTLFP